MAKAGEVRTSDLGMVAKVRPCLRLTVYPADDEFALVTVPPHTTARRGQRRGGLALPTTFLRSGAFHLQQVQPACVSRLDRRLGILTAEKWTTV